jgi:glycosyltransferase involved in cell wall biosynthesis
VEVLTTAPNRYATHNVPALAREEYESLRIERISLPPHRSGMVDQAIAYLVFALGLMKRLARRKYDLVFATSGRLMTAFLGSLVARRLNVPLYLDIRDIFVDTIKDVLPGRKGRVLLPLFRCVERATMRRADRINLVSEGFRPYFESRYPGVTYDFFSNGIDEEFLSEPWQMSGERRNGPIRVLYAGNIGEGQGLHRILPGMAKSVGDAYEFVVVGDGGRRTQLLDALKRMGVSTVSVRNPVPRRELMALYHDADVLFLHLNDYDAFANVLPSKIFEYAATGKPLLAGVAGYSADFLRDRVPNCSVFPPCDVERGVRSLLSLRLAWTDRAQFIEPNRRATTMKRMATAVIGVATCHGSTLGKDRDRPAKTL